VLEGGGEGGKRGDLDLGMFAGGSSSENGRLYDDRLALDPIFAREMLPLSTVVSNLKGWLAAKSMKL